MAQDMPWLWASGLVFAHLFSAFWLLQTYLIYDPSLIVRAGRLVRGWAKALKAATVTKLWSGKDVAALCALASTPEERVLHIQGNNASHPCTASPAPLHDMKAHRAQSSSALEFEQRDIVIHLPVIRRLSTMIVPMNLMWHDVSCAYKTPGGLKHVLQGVHGSARPGEMQALMGPSGAGKSTLMDILALRKSMGVIGGQVLVNGQPPNKDFVRKTAYVPQADNFIPTMTTYETLLFYASLILPASMSPRMHQERIRDVMEVLGLALLRSTLVGGTLPGGLMLRGLSGGERKRLSIAAGIVATPSVVFLDEPTSGLDSFAALTVMSYLKQMVSKSCHILIASIHQPRSAIWNMFDTVTVLSHGMLLYMGMREDMLHWFSGHLGYHYDPALHGVPSDWLMDLVCVSFNKSKDNPSHTISTIDEVQAIAKRFRRQYLSASSLPLDLCIEEDSQESSDASCLSHLPMSSQSSDSPVSSVDLPIQQLLKHGIQARLFHDADTEQPLCTEQDCQCRGHANDQVTREPAVLQADLQDHGAEWKGHEADLKGYQAELKITHQRVTEGMQCSLAQGQTRGINAVGKLGSRMQCEIRAASDSWHSAVQDHQGAHTAPHWTQATAQYSANAPCNIPFQPLRRATTVFNVFSSLGNSSHSPSHSFHQHKHDAILDLNKQPSGNASDEREHSNTSTEQLSGNSSEDDRERINTSTKQLRGKASEDERVCSKTSSKEGFPMMGIPEVALPPGGTGRVKKSATISTPITLSSPSALQAVNQQARNLQEPYPTQRDAPSATITVVTCPGCSEGKVLKCDYNAARISHKDKVCDLDTSSHPHLPQMRFYDAHLPKKLSQALSLSQHISPLQDRMQQSRWQHSMQKHSRRENGKHRGGWKGRCKRELWQWCVQYRTLLWREVLTITRNPADVAGRILTFTWVAVAEGLICYQLPDQLDSIPVILNTMFLGLAFFMLMPYVSMSLFSSDKQFYMGDMAAKLYRPWAYYCAKVTATIPFALVTVFAYTSIFYGLVGFRPGAEPVAQHFFMAALVFLISQQVLHLASVIAPNQDLAFMYSIGWTAINLLMSNFFIRYDDMHFQWLSMLRYISMLGYAFEGQVLAEFQNRAFSCSGDMLTDSLEMLPNIVPDTAEWVRFPPLQQALHTIGQNCSATGNIVLMYYGFHLNYAKVAGILVCYLGLLHCLTFLALVLLSQREWR